MSEANDALKNALTRIGAAVNDALAALPGDDEPETVIEVVSDPPDYHAQELERIAAEADAQKTVIEAEADAVVAVIEAQADAAGDTVTDLATDPVDTADNIVDDAITDNPIVDETITPADDPGDLADVGETIEESGDLLDALPVLEPEEVGIDLPPAPNDWYRRPRFRRH